MNKKKAILVASFGSSYKKARTEQIKPIEELIMDNFSDYKVVRAFTSNRIINKLKKENIVINTPEEALSILIEEGYEDIIVQPTHIIPGFEYDKLKKIVSIKNHNKDVHITISNPLLYHKNDYKQVIEALKTYVPEASENEAVVLMGHGTEHYANASYYYLQYLLESQDLPILIGTIEDGIELLLKRLTKGKYKKVFLMPFLLVAGDHAHNDMAGDDDDSWKNILTANGVEVETITKGLGNNKEVRQIYINHLKEVMNKQ
ncbi:MAG: sirohydrochlorin cobaltochelatase [Vallitalea sp.]|jgi:sirohydrochlorin cobaltochelatase|nr:sirohydrochlorin cobaltochelatase [Vallitalea sp.]